MKNTRIKTAAIPPSITRERAEEHMLAITQLTISRTALVAEMDEEIACIRSRYEGRIGEVGRSIQDHTEILRDWANANPGEFTKKKSVEFLNGILGFRTGTPKLKTLKGWTFARVLEAMDCIRWFGYVRTKREVDKELLLSHYANDALSDSELREIGVKVEQEETFYVDPAVSEQEARQTMTKEAA